MAVQNKKIGEVCVAIPRDHTFVREALRGVLRRLRSERISMLYRAEWDDLPRCPAHVRGVILVLKFSRWIGRLRRLRRPVINVGTWLPPTLFPSVVVDNRAVGRMAAEHFCDRGYRHFSFLGVGGQLYYDRLRLAAFSETLAQRGQACREMLPPDTPPQQREELIRRWLRDVPKPVAVLAANDLPAIELLDHCREAGVSVPGEVGVMGVGNDEVLCELTDPPLSSIDQNALLIGDQAAALMARLLAGEPPPKEPILMAPRWVVVRESSGAAVSVNPGLAPILSYIWERAAAVRGVDDLCRQFLLSRRSLEELFKKHLGRSPAREILRVRVEHAKTRLAETGQTLKSIAGSLGFRDLSHFIRVFHRQTGLTPADYRRQNPLR